jgi:hypothetical protein
MALFSYSVNYSPFRIGMVLLDFLLPFTSSTHSSNILSNGDLLKTALLIVWNALVLLDFFGFS